MNYRFVPKRHQDRCMRYSIYHVCYIQFPNPARQAARYVGELRDAQRHAYNRVVERLRQDPTHVIRPAESVCRAEARYSAHAVRSAQVSGGRDPAGRNGVRCVERVWKVEPKVPLQEARRQAGCRVRQGSRYVGDESVFLPLLGGVRLLGEQEYKWPFNRLHGARSFRPADATPYSNAKPQNRVYGLRGVRAGAAVGPAVGADGGITNPTVVTGSDGSVACYDTASDLRKNALASDKERRRFSRPPPQAAARPREAEPGMVERPRLLLVDAGQGDMLGRGRDLP